MSVIWITCNDKKFQARLRILLRVWKPDRRSVFSFHVTRLSVHVSIEFRSIYKWMSMWWTAIHKWDKKRNGSIRERQAIAKRKAESGAVMWYINEILIVFDFIMMMFIYNPYLWCLYIYVWSESKSICLRTSYFSVVIFSK